MKKKYIFFDIDGTLTDKKTGQIFCMYCYRESLL